MLKQFDSPLDLAESISQSRRGGEIIDLLEQAGLLGKAYEIAGKYDFVSSIPYFAQLGYPDIQYHEYNILRGGNYPPRMYSHKTHKTPKSLGESLEEDEEEQEEVLEGDDSNGSNQ